MSDPTRNAIYKPSRWGETFHALPYEEVLGAGAAGPGKTLVLLMDPMAQIVVESQRQVQKDHPFPVEQGQSTGWALHLRRTVKQLEQTIIRSKRIFPIVDPGAKYDEQKTTWVFSSGYHFQFGHCKDPSDWGNYLSSEFCAAGGTRVLMADGSLRTIETIDAGEMVQTLEGPRRVTASWNTGRKPCVEAVVRVHGEIVGTQIHPTTHPVLQLPIGESICERSPGSHRTGERSRPHGYVWQDYESLLCGAPESPVKRVSRVGEESAVGGSSGSSQDAPRLPTLTVQLALHGPSIRRCLEGLRSSREAGERRSGRAPSLSTRPETSPPTQVKCSGPARGGQASPPGPGRSACTGACGGACGLPGSGTPTDSPRHCSSCPDPRGGQPRLSADDAREQPPRSAGAETRSPRDCNPGGPGNTPPCSAGTPWSYPHFYSGECRPRTEDVHMGTAELRFAGWFETFDLTVEGANHYISESGIINAQTHIAYDELVQFLREQYDNINTRLRSSDPVLRHMLKIRAMSNPMVQRDGEAFSVDPAWVRERFVKPARGGGTVLEERTKRSDGREVVQRRMYLKATLYDNPDKDFVEQYEAKLLFSPPHIRAAMLHGDWFATAGSFFGEEWNSRIHVIRPHNIPHDWPQWRSLDWGYKKPGCIHWWAMDPDDNVICTREMYFVGLRVKEVGKMIVDAEKRMKLWRRGASLITGPADTQLWEKRGDEGASKAESFAEMGISWVPADKRSRARNAERIADRLKDHDNGATVPGIMFFETCPKVIETLPSIQSTPDDPETPLDGGDDHAFDSTGYSCAFASHGRARIPRFGKHEDEDDYSEEDSPKRRAGNGWGYG